MISAPPTQPEPHLFKLPNGMNIAADRAGPAEGQSVLLLHGGGQTRHAWQHTSRALASAGYFAVSVDLRGHGESSFAPNGAYETSDFVEDLRALMREMPSPPALVGASLGGTVSLMAQDAAARDGEGAAALILVDMAPRMESSGVQRILSFMAASPDGFPSLEAAQEQVASYLPHRKKPPTVDGLRKNLRQKPNGRWYWHWDPALMQAWAPERFDAARVSAIRERRLEAARRLNVPTLLVRGKASDVVSEAGAQEFLAACPSAEWVDLAGATHMVAGDSNAVFSETVVHFLNKIKLTGK